MSYIIADKKVVAVIREELKSGTVVRVAYNTVTNNGTGIVSLVNAVDARISNAKKWAKDAAHADFAISISQRYPLDFCI